MSQRVQKYLMSLLTEAYLLFKFINTNSIINKISGKHDKKLSLQKHFGIQKHSAKEKQTPT